MEIELTVLDSLTIYQPKHGYRFSIEPFVLTHNINNKKGTVVDFGSGCGIISIILAKNNPKLQIYAVENNFEMLELIKKNIDVNNISNVTVTDSVKNIETNSIDMIISNPPYFKKDSYRDSKRFFSEKFENQPINKILKNFRRIIKNKGWLIISYHPTRLIELINRLNDCGFGIKKIKPVYGNRKRDATFLIVSSQFNAKNYSIYEKAIYLEDFLKN